VVIIVGDIKADDGASLWRVNADAVPRDGEFHGITVFLILLGKLDARKIAADGQLRVLPAERNLMILAAVRAAAAIVAVYIDFDGIVLVAPGGVVDLMNVNNADAYVEKVL